MLPQKIYQNHLDLTIDIHQFLGERFLLLIEVVLPNLLNRINSDRLTFNTCNN